MDKIYPIKYNYALTQKGSKMAKDVICKFAGVGLVSGAFGGLALGIWACVQYVEPAFDATKGINESGAKALTALVALSGAAPAILGGAIGGAIAFTMVGCFVACCIGAIACCAGAPSVSRQNNASQYHSAAPTLFRQTIQNNKEYTSATPGVAIMV